MFKARFIEREKKPNGLLKFRPILDDGTLAHPTWGHFVCQGVESDCDLVMGNDYWVKVRKRKRSTDSPMCDS